MNDVEQLARLHQAVQDLRTQVGARIVGQSETVHGMLPAILSGGHALLVGVPGLAQTLMISGTAAPATRGGGAGRGRARGGARGGWTVAGPCPEGVPWQRPASPPPPGSRPWPPAPPPPPPPPRAGDAGPPAFIKEFVEWGAG